MKYCPYCAEEIQDAAIKCRYCGESLQSGAVKPEKSGDVDSSQVQNSDGAESSSRLTSILFAFGEQIEKVMERFGSDIVAEPHTRTREVDTPATTVASDTSPDQSDKGKLPTKLSQHFKRTLMYAGIFSGIFAVSGVLIYLDLGSALGKGTLSVGSLTLFYVFYSAHRENEVPYALVGLTITLVVFFAVLAVLPD